MIDSASSAHRPVRADDPALTAVRGIAAFWVFFYHAWVAAGPQLLALPLGFAMLELTPIASIAWIGVDIFFVLSGFLLWGLFDNWASRRTDEIALGRYAARRTRRILPPYYGQLLLLAVLGHVTGWLYKPTVVNLAWHALLLHAWSLPQWGSINGVWWTLSIEVQYYLALPLLAWLIRRAGWGTALAIGLATMFAWRIGAFHMLSAEAIPTKVWAIEQLPGRIDQFLAGMFACHLARTHDGGGAMLRAAVLRRRWLYRALLAVGPVTLVALAYRMHVDAFYLRYWDGHPWLCFWHLVAGISVAITLYALGIRTARPVVEGAPARRSWWKRALVGFGVVSYSFYLWHQLLLDGLQPVILHLTGLRSATPATFAITLASGLVVALAAALISYLLLERPFLQARASQ